MHAFRNLSLVGAALLGVVTTGSAWAGNWSHFLPQEEVRRVVYDRAAQLYWFGSSNGVWRYDGQTFVLLPQPPNAPPLENLSALALDAEHADLWIGTPDGLYLYLTKSMQWGGYFDKTALGLASHNVTALFVERGGRLWYATGYGGVGIKDSSFIPLQSPNRILRQSYVECLAQDSSGNTYLGTRDNGLYILPSAADTLHHFTDFPNPAFMCVQAIAIDQRERKWLGTAAGVLVLDAANTRAAYYTTSNSDLIDNNVYAVWIESSTTGEVKWFGTNAGVSVLGEKERRWQKFTNQSTKSGLASDKVRDITGDDDGNIWFGTLDNRGVSRLNNNWSALTEDEGLPGNFTFNVEIDALDRLWVGTDSDARGVAVLDTNGSWRDLSNTDLGCGMLDVQVTDLLREGERGMWVATTVCGLVRVSKDLSTLQNFNTGSFPKFPSDEVWALLQTPDALWVGTAAGLARLLLQDDEVKLDTVALPNTEVTALAQDHRRHLWVGTDSGLVIFDGSNWRKLPEFTEALRITSLAYDRNTSMWIGTEQGLLRYDGTHLRRFTTSEGLPDNRVSVVKVATDGTVWCGTVNGAAAYSNNAWTAYTTDDGLSDDYINDIAFGPPEVVWFATYGGGVSRYRRSGLAPNTFVIEPFDLVTESNVTFRYSGYDFNTPFTDLRYQVALDDTLRWSSYSTERSVTLAVTEDGPHTFYVRTIDKDNNIDPTPAQFRFQKISPKRGGVLAIGDAATMEKFGALWLYLPPNAIKPGISLHAAPFIITGEEDLPGAFTGLAYTLAPTGIAIDPRKPITLKIFYRQTLVDDSSIDESKLALYRYQSGWQHHGGMVDQKEKSLTTTITQLDTFALFEASLPTSLVASSAALSEIAAQPRVLSPNGSGLFESTTISFTLGQPTEVTVKVYNRAGRLVRVLAENRFMNAGRNAVEWNGCNENEKRCDTGLHFIIVAARGHMLSKPVMVVNK